MRNEGVKENKTEEEEEKRKSPTRSVKATSVTLFLPTSPFRNAQMQKHTMYEGRYPTSPGRQTGTGAVL